MDADLDAQIRRAWTAYAIVAGALAVGALNISIVFVVYPELQRAFDASAAGVSWTITVYSITVAALTMPSGWLADRLGRRRQFLIGVSVFGLGCGLVALAPTLPLMIGARIVQAAGLAIQTPAAQAIVLTAFPPARRSSAVGAIGALGGLCSAIGPVVGGALADLAGWRWAFASMIPVCLATVAVGARWLPRDAATPGSTARRFPDPIGTSLLVTAIVLVALAIVRGAEWGWISAATLATFALGVAALTAMLTRSRHHADPIVDVTLWRFRSFRVGTGLVFVLAGHFGSVYLTSFTLLTTSWGLSRFRGGLALAMIPCVAGPLTFAAGRWADRHGHRRLVVPGSAVFVVTGLFLAAHVSRERHLLLVWLPAVILYGVSVGLSHTASQSAALLQIPADRLGRASATSRIFNDLGTTVWIAVAVAITSSAPDFTTGARRVFATMVIVGVFGIVVGSRLPRPTERGQSPQ